MTRKIKRFDYVKLVDVIKESYECGAREIGFYTTGEPFVYKGIEDIIKKSKEIGYEYTYISTNGALATPSRAKKVIESGIDSIKFSINAFDKENYKLVHGQDDFESVLNNLKYISNYRKINKKSFRLFVSSVVTNITEKEIKSFKKLMKNLVDEVQFNAVTVQGGYMNKAYDLLKVSKTGLKVLDQNFNKTKESEICMVPFNRLHVTCEGFLTACCVDYQNYLTVADLNLVSVKEAWSSKEFVELRKKHLSGNLKNTLCDNCWNNKCEKVSPINEKLGVKINELEHSKNIKKEIIHKLNSSKA
jgi:MoaA/NifB/PqqE/SkfB family radical SAM enzyme